MNGIKKKKEKIFLFSFLNEKNLGNVERGGNTETGLSVPNVVSNLLLYSSVGSSLALVLRSPPPYHHHHHQPHNHPPDTISSTTSNYPNYFYGCWIHGKWPCQFYLGAMHGNPLISVSSLMDSVLVATLPSNSEILNWTVTYLRSCIC